MESLINWESLGAFGVVLAIMALLVRSIILGMLKSTERREEKLLQREDKNLEREEKLLEIMRQTTESIGVHTETMREVQKTMISERDAIMRQILRTEKKLSREIIESRKS